MPVQSRFASTVGSLFGADVEGDLSLECDFCHQLALCMRDVPKELSRNDLLNLGKA